MYPASTTVLSSTHPLKNTGAWNVWKEVRLGLTIHVFEVLLGADFAHGLFQSAVVDRLLFRLWEKVGHDAVEELQVVL